MTRTVVSLSVLLCLSASAPARADLAAEARFHDEQARQHYAARRYREAVRAFMVEQRLAPNPNILFNIGLCLQQLNEHEEAYMYFAEFLASDDDDAERRRMANEAVDALRPRVALVEITSEPPGSAIFVDRRELGQYGVTPRTLALGAGEHEVWVEREGYRRATASVTLAVGSQRTLRLEPEQILGRLRLRSAVEASVRISSPGGVVAWSGRTPVDEELPPGTYQVEASTGSERWSEPLVVRGGAITEATAALRGPVGRLTITTNQAGAIVEVDGRERGFTPQVMSDIPVGTHQLRVSVDEMQPYEGEVSIEEDATTWMAVDLVPATNPANPAIWTVGGVGLATLIGAAITTGFAVDTYNQWEDAYVFGDREYFTLAQTTDQLSLAADVLWLAGGVAAGAALVLWLATFDFEERESRANIVEAP